MHVVPPDSYIPEFEDEEELEPDARAPDPNTEGQVLAE